MHFASFVKQIGKLYRWEEEEQLHYRVKEPKKTKHNVPGLLLTFMVPFSTQNCVTLAETNMQIGDIGSPMFLPPTFHVVLSFRKSGRGGYRVANLQREHPHSSYIVNSLFCRSRVKYRVSFKGFFRNPIYLSAAQ